MVNTLYISVCTADQETLVWQQIVLTQCSKATLSINVVQYNLDASSAYWTVKSMVKSTEFFTNQCLVVVPMYVCHHCDYVAS